MSLLGPPRLDVDDDVCVGEPRAQRFLDAVGGRVSLADGRTGRDADHDVGEVGATGLAHAQPSKLDRGIELGDGPPCALLRVGRSPVHEDVHVSPEQAAGGDDHENRDEERRDGVAGGEAEGGEGEAGEDGERAGKVASEVERVREERVAPLLPAGSPGDGQPRRVDRDHAARSPRTSTRSRRPRRRRPRRGAPRQRPR